MTRTPSPDACDGQLGLLSMYPATNSAHSRMRPFGRRHGQAIGRVIGLLAGRSTYRAAVSVSSLMLLDAWGPHEFGRYWTLVGSFLVLQPVTSWGIEKAALNLIPQAGTRLQPIFVRLSIGLCTLSLTMIALLVLILPLADPGLFALVGVTVALQGANQALVGLARAIGRPALDTINFGVSAAALLALAEGVRLAGWGAEVFAGSQLALVCLLNAVLLRAVALPGSSRATRLHWAAGDFGPDRAVKPNWWEPAVTAGVMGFHTVIGTLPLSLCFILLFAHGMEEEAAKFGVAFAVIGALLALYQYLLRLSQPTLVVLLRDTRAGHVITWVRRGTAAAAISMPPYGLGIIAIASLIGAADSLYLQAILLVLLGLPILCITEFVNFFYENHSAAALPRVSICILMGCAAAAAAAAVLLPSHGSVGAMAAIFIGEETNLLAACLLMRWRIDPGSRRNILIERSTTEHSEQQGCG